MNDDEKLEYPVDLAFEEIDELKAEIRDQKREIAKLFDQLVAVRDALHLRPEATKEELAEKIEWLWAERSRLNYQALKK